ncbi:unnamed protein product [Phytophthora lilii]|uniref:Unnamed protein product n=1 Tax=Phytophthora lilii TaxID=2077276 RepID=A0A9W7D837_9STRA|nr:unnamed protein product [Phytophthora lilii]
MHGPSTSSDDWRRQQQQQEQLRQLRTQMQQQGQQIQGQVERRTLPTYSSVGGSERTTWSREMQQSDDGGLQRSRQMPLRPAPLSAYSSGHGGSQVANGIDRMFPPPQVPPPQSHFPHQGDGNYGASVLQSWGGNNSMSFSGTRTEGPFQMQGAQRFLPQQQQQPQPYYPPEVIERRHQETGTVRQPSRSFPDDSLLTGIMRHFPTSSQSTAAPRTTASSNGVFVEARDNRFIFTSATAQPHDLVQGHAEMQLRQQTEVPPKLPVLPTGAVIVPGVSLSSPSMRLVTMRDLLNGDDGTSKVDMPKSRPRGGNSPPKRKAPRKKTPAKRQRMPQQQPANKSAGDTLPSQSSRSEAPALASKSPPPMYLAFMESRAARALAQTNTELAMPSVSAPQSQLSVSTNQVPSNTVRQSGDRTTEIVTEVPNPVKRKRATYKRKKAGGQPDNETPLATNQPGQQQSINHTVPFQHGTESGGPTDEQLPEFSHGNTAENQKMTDGRQTLGNGQLNSNWFSGNPISGDLAQRQRQQLNYPPNTAQAPTMLDKVENGKLSTISQKRRETKTQQARQNSWEPELGAVAVSAVLSKAPASHTVATASLSMVDQERPVSDPPHVENRTVVIFCKRDFMRYQAAKIWRKFQEQRQKQEEWREVRVAGKRTRYLNSRYYEDELRRTHRKPYTRAGRPRKKATRGASGKDGTKTLSSTAVADPAAVESTVSSSVLVNDEEMDVTSQGTEIGRVVDSSGTSSGASDVHSSHGELVPLEHAPESLQCSPNVLLQSDNDTKSDETSSASPDTASTGANGTEDIELHNRASNGIQDIVVADLSSKHHEEVTNASSAAPDVNVNPAGTGAQPQSSASTKATDAATDTDVVMTAVHTTVTVSGSSTVADGSPSGSIEVINVASRGNTAAEAVPHDNIEVATSSTSDGNSTTVSSEIDEGHLKDESSCSSARGTKSQSSAMKHPCSDSGTQDGILVEKLAETTISDSTSLVETVQRHTTPGAQDNALPAGTACGGLVTLHDDAVASSQPKQSCTDSARHTDNPQGTSDMSTDTNGAVSSETKQSRSDSEVLNGILPDASHNKEAISVTSNSGETKETGPKSAKLDDVLSEKSTSANAGTNSIADATV